MSTVVERYQGFVEAYKQKHNDNEPGLLKRTQYAIQAFFGRSVSTHDPAQRYMVLSSVTEQPSDKKLESRDLSSLGHTVARNPSLAPEGYNRSYVPDDRVSWDSKFVDYAPTKYTAEKVLAKPIWADPLDPKDVNWQDKAHQSHLGEIKFDETGMPLNPKGRTGTEGRGELGKWGPNQAADPIITRDGPDGPDGPCELLVIERRDNGQWALPGGMVDPTDESFSATAIRELAEEALNSPAALDDDIKSQLASLEDQLKQEGKTEKEIKTKITGLRNQLVFEKLKDSPGFQQPKEVYKGYVDDPRNTDHAWMETTGYHTHISRDNPYLNEPEAGDDAKSAQWVKVTPKLIKGLYASHSTIVQNVPRIKAICA